MDARTGVYALGLTMYELFTRQTAFTGDSPVAIAAWHRARYVPENTILSIAGAIETDEVERLARAANCQSN